MAHWSIDYVVMPLCLPFLLLWIGVSRIIGFLMPFLVVPSLLMVRSMYWAVPLAKSAWKKKGISGFFQKVGFEATYCMNITRRFLTLPIRRSVPQVYILGFPKCGTTALASYLMQHPAISGVDGLPWDPALSKESHFFNGVLGPRSTRSKMMYRSFFPTIVTRWWREVVRRCGTWKCMDACPLNACLPYVADRIATMSPNAKLIFMVRDPVEAVFSAEIMLRNTGMDLDWSFMEDVVAADPRFAESPEDESFFERLSMLKADEGLPADLPQRIYGRSSSVLYFSKFADRIAPYLSRFPRENILFVEFREFNSQPQKTVENVMEFVGVDPKKYTFKPVPMWSGERRGRRMHPAVKRKLQHYFALPNQRLYAIVGKAYSWGDGASSSEEEEIESQIVIPVAEQLKEAGKQSYASAVDLLPEAAIGRKESRSRPGRTISVSAVV